MNTKTTNRQLRQFGVIFCIGILVIFGLLMPYLFQEAVSGWIVLTAISIGLIALVVPIAVKPLYIVWLKLGAVLGWINTRIILGIVYFVVFMPMGLFMRLFGNDPMNRCFKKDKTSYRVKTHPIDSKKMEKPY